MHAVDWAALGGKVIAHVGEHKMIYGIIAAVILVFMLGRYTAN